MNNCTYEEPYRCKACGEITSEKGKPCSACYNLLYVQELKGTIATLIPHLTGSEVMLAERMLEGITIAWTDGQWQVVRQRTCTDCEKTATVQHKASGEWYCRGCIFRHIHIEV